MTRGDTAGTETRYVVSSLFGWGESESTAISGGGRREAGGRRREAGRGICAEGAGLALAKGAKWR